MFVLTEDQRLIHEAARTLLVENCTTEQLRKMLADGRQQDDGRWTQILEMGLTSILVAEQHGGLGLGAVEFVGVAEAAGYVALPEPLVEQGGVVLPLLAALGDSQGWLDRVMAGSKVAIDHTRQRFVADADKADALVLCADDAIHIVERNQLEFIKQPSIDPFRELSRVVCTPGAESRVGAGAEAQNLIAAAFERGALFSAAQCLGLAQRCVDMAVHYAQERTQFGKPIGSYQAVKHMLANVQVQIEFARPVVYAAAVELPLGGPIAAARVSHAKLVAAEAADFAARTALQVHGAMGFTWEVDLHFFMKRALGLTASWGNPAFHRTRVIQRMLEQPLGPDALFASELKASA